MPKKKEITCLADLVNEEIEEFNDIIDDGFFDCLEENADMDQEWKRALKDLEELGFTEEVE